MKRIIAFLIGMCLLGFSWLQAQGNDKDLKLTEFTATFKRLPAYEGDTVLLKACVKNTGSVDWVAPSGTGASGRPYSQPMYIYFFAGDVQWYSIPSLTGDYTANQLKELASDSTYVFEGYWVAEYGSYGQLRVRLQSYMGDSIDELKDGVHPDGFEVLRACANDLALSDMSVSTSAASVVFYDGDILQVEATLKNQGREAQNDVEVSLLADGQVVDTVLLGLEAEAEQNVRLAYIAAEGVHALTLVLPEDENVSNDTLRSQAIVFAETDWVESFEGTEFPPAGWQIQDGNEYSFYHDTYSGYHGSASVSFSSSNVKLVTPKLDVQADDVLHFALKTDYAGFKVSTSTDLLHWDSLAFYPSGGSGYALYQFDFSTEEYASLVGKRYFAFEQVEGWSGVLDLVYGPQPIEIENDFSLLSVYLQDGFLQAGMPANIGLVIKNNGVAAAATTVLLMSEADTLAMVESEEVEAGAEARVSVSFTPVKDTMGLTLNARLPEDDVDANNFVSLETMVYPAEITTPPALIDFENASSLEDSAFAYWVVREGSNDYNPAYWELMNRNDMFSNPNPYDGDEVLFLYRPGSLDTSILFTPLYALPHERYTISFYLYRDMATSIGDKVNVWFNTRPDKEGAVFVDSIYQDFSRYPVEDTVGWYFYSFDVDARDVSQGFFFLEGIGGADWSYTRTYIDNLSITGISAHDLALIDILPTDSARIWGHQQAPQDVVAVICNVGEDTMTSATLKWSVDGQAQADVAWTGKLPAGDTTQVLLSEDFLFGTGLYHTVHAEIVAPYDTANTANNAFEVSIDVPQALLVPYTNGFEADTSLDYWLALDKDRDGFNWEMETSLRHGGTYSMASYSFDFLEEGGDTILTPDNWLVSPAIYVSEDTLLVSFFVGAGAPDTYEETYEVLLSAKGTDTSDFVPLHKETLTSDDYKEVNLKIAGYKDSLVFLAFRHYESTNNYFLTIDDLSLSYPEKPETLRYTVSVSADPVDGGTVAGGGEFEAGTQVTVEATANEGYSFTNWTKDGEIVDGAESSYTFQLDEDMALVAHFELVPPIDDTTWYIIEVSVEGQGSITPDGTIRVMEGADQTFSISAADGWLITDVLVDDASAGVVETYTFENVSENHTIHAIFVPETANETGMGIEVEVYPNPTTGKVFVLTGKKSAMLRLFNHSGTLLWSGEVVASPTVLNLESYPAGLYILDIDGYKAKILKK